MEQKGNDSRAETAVAPAKLPAETQQAAVPSRGTVGSSDSQSDAIMDEPTPETTLRERCAAALAREDSVVTNFAADGNFAPVSNCWNR